MNNPQQFYSFKKLASEAYAPVAWPRPDYEAVVWRPNWPHLKPASLPVIPFSVWGIFHYCKIFANHDYALLLVTYRGKLIHRSCIFPGYFRFPFMAGIDLQIGDTWTDENHRGQGLAAQALMMIVREFRQPSRTFWYLCDEANQASSRVAQKAGFKLAGIGFRKKRLGISILGYFQLQQSPLLPDISK
jgi:RimJ/RimL family protein N-acetyltransferase